MAIVTRCRGAVSSYGTYSKYVRYLSYSMAASRYVTVESLGLGVRHI